MLFAKQSQLEQSTSAFKADQRRLEREVAALRQQRAGAAAATSGSGSSLQPEHRCAQDKRGPARWQVNWMKRARTLTHARRLSLGDPSWAPLVSYRHHGGAAHTVLRQACSSVDRFVYLLLRAPPPARLCLAAYLLLLHTFLWLTLARLQHSASGHQPLL